MEELGRLNEELDRVRKQKDHEALVLERLRREEKVLLRNENERKELLELLREIQEECNRKEKRRKELLETLKVEAAGMEENELNRMLMKLKEQAAQRSHRLSAAGGLQGAPLDQIPGVPAKENTKTGHQKGPERVVSDLTMESLQFLSSTNTFPTTTHSGDRANDRVGGHGDATAQQPRKSKRPEKLPQEPTSPAGLRITEQDIKQFVKQEKLKLQKKRDQAQQDYAPPRPSRKKSQELVASYDITFDQDQYKPSEVPAKNLRSETMSSLQHASQTSDINLQSDMNSPVGRSGDGYILSQERHGSLQADIHFEPLSSPERRAGNRDIHFDRDRGRIFPPKDEIPGRPSRQISHGAQVDSQDIPNLTALGRSQLQATLNDIHIDPEKVVTAGQSPFPKSDIVLEGSSDDDVNQDIRVPREIKLAREKRGARKQLHAMAPGEPFQGMPSVPRRRASGESSYHVEREPSAFLSEQNDEAPGIPTRQRTMESELDVNVSESHEVGRRSFLISEICIESRKRSEKSVQNRSRSSGKREDANSSRKEDQSLCSIFSDAPSSKMWNDGSFRSGRLFSMDSGILSSPSEDRAPKTPSRRKSDPDFSCCTPSSIISESPGFGSQVDMDSQILCPENDDKAPKTPSRRQTMLNGQRESMKSLSSSKHITVDIAGGLCESHIDEVIDMGALKRKTLKGSVAA